MAAATDQGTGQVNGQAPAAGDDIEPVPVSERIMGAIGFLFAVGIALVAIDLMTGGMLSDLFARDNDDTG
jgi:hypothetical protein